MAEELSRIGIAVDSKQAENSLNNIKNQLRSTAKDVKLFDEYWDKLNSTLYSAASGFTSDNALLKQMATAVKETAQGVNQLNATLNSYVQGATKVYKVGKKVVDEQRQLLKTTNDMAKQANRFNFGNINAQLQDIIVTSQMGMRPLSIGLQQGTQLVYILQQSKAPLADFKAGLKSLISPLSLAVVGITTLVAVGIQYVDWADVAHKAARGLADVVEYLAHGISDALIPAITALGIVLLPISTAAKIVVGAIAAIIAVVDHVYRLLNDGKSIFDKFTEYLKELAEGVDDATKSFEKFDKTIEDKLKNLEDRKFEDSIRDLDAGTQAYVKTSRELNHLLAESIKDEPNAILHLGEKWKAIEKVASGERDYARAIDERKKAEKAEKDRIRASKEYADTIAGLRKEYEDLAISYQTKISDMQFEKSTRGLTDEQKLVAQINHEYDQEIAKLERKVALKEIDTGLFAKEKAELDKIKEGLIENSLEQDRYNESVKNFNAVMDYSSSVTKGFFSDLKKGLKDGESAWESFTNAVINMLDKIQDKILDLAIDQMFNSLKQSNAASGSSNWLSGIINAGVSWVSGSSNVSVGQGALNAMGGQMGVKPTMTANGGVFSNGIYSSPTVFQFAKGGKFGVMGEAGPEAVMPLRRTSDGSLGVKAEGVGGSNVVVNVINNSNAQARTEQRQTAQGMEIDVMIDEMVAEKMARPGTASNSALRAYNNQQLITR